MAEPAIIIPVEIPFKAPTESVKSLRAEIRGLTQDIASGKLKGDDLLLAAERAGELESRFKTARNTINAFNPEAKFAAFAGVLGGVADGFSTIEGAMALFGTENKDVQEAILKTQGAMAIATGINGLIGMKSELINLALVIKSNVIAAFSSLKSALITTGIGAMVIALGIIIDAVMDYNEELEREAGFQERLNDAIKKYLQLLDEQADKSEKLRNAKKGGLDEANRELQLLEAQGASEQTLFEKREEILNKELFNLKVRKATGLDVAKELADKQAQIKANQAAHDKAILDKQDADEVAALQRKEKLLEAQGADEKTIFNASQAILEQELTNLKDRQKRGLDVKTEIANKENEIYANKIAYEQKVTSAVIDRIQKEIDQYLRLATFKEDYFKKEEEENLAHLQQQTEINRQEFDQRQATIKAEIDLEDKKKNAQLDTFSAVGAGLNALSQLVGDNVEASKALGVASATIDTYVGATKAFAQGGVLGFIGAAAIILAGLANVQRILAVQVPGSNKGISASNIQTGSFGAPPSLQAQSNLTTLSGSNTPILTNQLNIKDQKVFVVESDIRTAQQRVDDINRKVTIH